MNYYYGIADAHGIESFLKESDSFSHITAMFFRARANPQRHSCLYKIKLTDKTARLVQDLCKEGHHKEALTLLKSKGKEVALAVGSQKSWDMIPNSDLDPITN